MILKVLYPIKKSDIENLLDCASTGSAYWCENTLGYSSTVKKAMSENGFALITDNEEEKTYRLTSKKIEMGLIKMAQYHPEDFADFIAGDYDQNTGDIFLQCALFGKVIYS